MGRPRGCYLWLFKLVERSLQGQFVALRAESADDALRKIREVRALTEIFSGVRIGQVNFNKRYRSGCERVAQRYAGVGERGGIDEDKV